MVGAGRIISLVCGTAYLCVVASSAAQSQMYESAQQFWLNEQQARSGSSWGSARDRRSYWDSGIRAFAPERLERPRRFDRSDRYDSAPLVEVESPDYYNYKADTFEPLRVEQLCQVKVASTSGMGATGGAASFADACALLPTMSLRVLPEVGAALTQYYSKHSQFAWLDNGQPNAAAKAVMAEMAKADSVGLSAADYKVALPAADAKDRPAVLKEALRFDLHLSAKVMTYVLDTTRGRVDPNRISGYHDLPRKKVDLVAALEEVLSTDAVAENLARRNPQSAQFRALAAEYEMLRRDAKPKITLPAGTSIKPGESDAALPNVIAAIAQSASSKLKEKHAAALEQGAPNEYSGALVALVRDFQRENGLRPDGVVGAKTLHALRGDTSAGKLRKLQMAMERLRWLPADFGNRYVFLNQPSFRVSVINGGQEQLSMPVVIGKKSNQTYFFTDKIEAVEYNPYWNMPRSIIVNEMLPKLYRNPSYLDNAGYEVFNERGRAVSSTSVSWDRVARNQVSVDVRQPPGPRNALGRLKIKFPNKHAIYMHDTPQKSLFKQARRALSHGCVRLEQPQAMAAALLGKPVDYVNDQIGAGKNKVEKVAQNIPVYLTYFTAWPDSKGKVVYFDDVYDRDDYLSRAIEKTEATRKAAG